MRLRGILRWGTKQGIRMGGTKVGSTKLVCQAGVNECNK